MDKTAKKKIILQSVIFAVSFAIAFFGARYLFSSAKTNNEMLIEISGETNRTLPKMIDTETRFDSITVKGDTMVNHFTLINIPNDTIELDIEAAKTEMMARAQINLDTNRVMKDIRERKITLFYDFYDNKRKKIFDYTVKHHTKN